MRRRHGRGHRAGRKRALDWLVNGTATTGSYNVTNTLIPGGLSPFYMELCGATNTNFENPTIQRFTIERIVGDMVLTNNGLTVGDAAVTLNFGVMVMDFEPIGGGSPNFSPLAAGDAVAEWMWLYHTCVVIEGNNQVRTWDYRSLAVDIRVKRVIHGNKRCWLACSYTNPNAAGHNLNLSVFLRTLISKVA